MTKFFEVQFDDDAYERLMRNRTAKEKEQYNRGMANNAAVLARSIDAHVLDLCTKSATRSLLRGRNANSSCAGMGIEGFDNKLSSPMFQD
ncbi:hypothetical protein YA0599_03380 [Pseudomonas syringae]|uniref:hypothetical protein n=1 Tax=Pseudomonas syringae TaxID=317 RepID=UPI0018E5BD8D|nr:hypothetical protein [Pseudomonas syringae]MBI6707256.1 hypothetical protein [Pseudomonas syringae]